MLLPLLAAGSVLLGPPQEIPLPRPKALVFESGSPLEGHRIHWSDPRLKAPAEAMAQALRTLGVPGKASREEDGVVSFRLKAALATEQHEVHRDGSTLIVSAGSPRAASQAAATLLQLLRIEEGRASWPAVSISDEPDVPYRSFMVDLGRNPHSPTTLRAVVDMMWLCKANYLQLHLGDDQLFSWPSRAFPKLYSEPAGWSWDDFVQLESYASARGVTLVPELEAPGHSTILRREYPEIFGTTTGELARSPRARAGLSILIDELLSVFRSTPFVHVGGDEAYGVPEEDQRDLINHLNRHLRSRGKRTLVWEGPGLGEGENKVDTDVLHFNWRTIDFPAQEMLDAGYQVVNASWNPLYVVDHYPRTMFTLVDLERCYDLDLRSFGRIDPAFPTFVEPHRTRSAEGILGFCMPYWEGRQENLFDLCLPRLSAVSSAAWNRAGENDFDGFLSRQERALALIEDIAGVELSRVSYASEPSQRANFAFRGQVVASSGSVQPPFVPARLTNGNPDRFDHFLGFPTQPDPLEITITLRKAATVGRVRIHERAVGQSHELYQLFVSADGSEFERVGETSAETRGESSFVDHTFTPRTVVALRIVTAGCHGLTFPSFSRLSEVEAFAR